MGIAGMLDFNNIELQQLRLQLDHLHSTTYLITFEGMLYRPPQSFNLEALLWLGLQNRKKSLTAGDANLLNYDAIMNAKIVAKPNLLAQAELYRQLADVSVKKAVYMQKLQQLTAMKLYQDELALQKKTNGI